MTQSERRTIGIGGLGLIFFVWLAYLVSIGAAGGFDSAVRHGVHSWISPPVTQLMRMATLFGKGVFLVPFGALCCWWMTKTRHGRDAMLFVGVSLGAELLNELLKLGFHRYRPEPYFGLQAPASYSFPSGHAFVCTVFYVSLAILTTRRTPVRAAAVVFVALIGYSRIYLGVHYPTDVLAGYALAVVCLSALLLYRRMPVWPSE